MTASATELDPEATIDRRQVDELALRRQRRTRRILTGLVAAALVLVVGLGGWVSVLRGDQQNQQVAGQQVNELLTAPDAKVYATTLNGAPVSFVVSKERDQALFLGDGVTAPADGKVYQLWMINGNQITPNALVDHGGDIDPVVGDRAARRRPAAGRHHRTGRRVHDPQPAAGGRSRALSRGRLSL